MRCIVFTLLVICCVLVSAEESRVRQTKPRRPRPRTTTTEPPSLTGHSEECPEKNGFYADAYQCDRYYECRDGQIIDHLCDDGLVFSDYSVTNSKCEFLFSIDCSDRPKLQDPRPSPHCPRKNGYFKHEDPKICDKFFYCVDGKYNRLECPAGLVFSEKTGTCAWADEAKREGCSSEELFEFKCPANNRSADDTSSIHPRYADPKDCQFFYVCINGLVPRRNGCSIGKVFNDQTKQCDEPKNVPECDGWYKGILDYEDDDVVATNKGRPSQSATKSKQKTKSG